MRVWIDYDISFGELANEVDDGLALIHAIIAEKKLKSFELVGLSTVHGNTSNMDFQERISKKILRIMSREDLPFFNGAGSSMDFGKTNPAVIGLKNELEKGPLVILAMGRLTNISTVLMLYPDLKKNISEIILMGGRRLEKKILFGRYRIEFPDMNIDGDVPAVKVLEKMEVPLTLIPTECMTERLIEKKHLIKMKQAGGAARFMAEHTNLWSWIWKILLGSPRGFIPWDVYMVSYLTHPSAFKCENIPYGVKELDNTTHHLYSFKRRRKKKFFLVVSPDLRSGPSSKYCSEIADYHVDELVDFWCDFSSNNT